MGLFMYSRIISSVCLKRSLTQSNLFVPALIMPCLVSTPHSFRTMAAISFLDPKALLEEKLKEALRNILSSIVKKAIV